MITCPRLSVFYLTEFCIVNKILIRLTLFVVLTFIFAPVQAFEFNTGSIGSLLKAGKALTLTDKEVIEIGKKTAKHSDATNKVAGKKNKYTKRLNKLVKKHLNEDKLKLNFKVYLDSNVNAFALPDGSIRIYSGLMDLMNDQELIGVIGHEIGHVKLKHSKQTMKTAYAAAAAREGVASQGGNAGLLADSQLGSLTEELANAQFSQAEETQSDDYSLSFMKKHHYDPKALVSAFKKLAKQSDSKGSLLSSHPAPGKRATRIAEKLK